MIFDITNALVCFTVVFIAWRIKKIPNWVALVLAVYSFLPFFMNGFLLPSGYMNDQAQYTATLDAVRSGSIMGNIQTGSCDRYDGNCPFFLIQKSVITGWFLALLPIPFVETVNSMGFFNRFLFLITFLWFYHKKFLRGMPLFFFIFYPSLVLYSSLALRDFLVLFFMMVSIIFLVDKKYFRFFMVIFPLYYLKYQNFYLMIILYLLFIIFEKKTFFYRIRYWLIFLSTTILLVKFDFILDLINSHRSAMYYENNNSLSAFIPLEGGYSFILTTIKGLPYFVMKPYPWEASNFFQLLQSVENILLLVFLIVFTKKAYNNNTFLTKKWMFFLIISMCIYGLIIFNFGTAVRYKFPFIVTYVIGLSYELYKIYGYRFDQNLKNKSNV